MISKADLHRRLALLAVDRHLSPTDAHLLQVIAANTFPRGDSWVCDTSHARLAAQLRRSQPSLRRSLASLATLGLLEYAPGIGRERSTIRLCEPECAPAHTLHERPCTVRPATGAHSDPSPAHSPSSRTSPETSPSSSTDADDDVVRLIQEMPQALDRNRPWIDAETARTLAKGLDTSTVLEARRHVLRRLATIRNPAGLMIHLLRNPQKIERRSMAPQMNVKAKPTPKVHAETVTLAEFRRRTGQLTK